MVIKKVKKCKSIAFIFFLLAYTLSAQNGHWTQLFPANSPQARRCFGMSSIGQNMVIIFGGINSNEELLNDTWIFELNSNNWTQISSPQHPSKRRYPSMTNLNEKKVLLFGGIDEENQTYFDDTWVFDLDSLTWYEMKPSNSPEKRYQSSATNLETNKIILYGGIDFLWNGLCDTWIYDLDSNKWTNLFVFGDISDFSEICKINDKFIFEFGGGVNKNDVNNTYLFNSKYKNQWKNLKIKNLPKARHGHSLAQLDENTIFLFGGLSNGGLNDSWIFNFKDTTWNEIETGNKPSIRYLHRMSTISKFKILMYSGYNDFPMVADTWLFTLDADDVQENAVSIEYISISPNPATDYIEISVPEAVNQRFKSLVQEVRIYNVFGQEVNPTLTPSPVGRVFGSPPLGDDLGGVLRIDVSMLPAGVYFVSIGEKVGKFVKI